MRVLVCGGRDYTDWVTVRSTLNALEAVDMLEEGKPDLVVAFRGGKGTADMVRRAKAAGIEVREIAARTPERLRGGGG